MSNDAPLRLGLPLTPDVARGLTLGQRVVLDGPVVVTAGFPTHKRMIAALQAGTPLPFDLSGGSFFHMGNCCYRQGNRDLPHYVNPTTSTRFDAFMPQLVRGLGLTAIGGKGGVGPEVVAALAETGGVYLAMPGGAAPMLTAGVAERLATGWDDLIEQFRLSLLSLDGFGPLTVGVDAHGHSLYDDLSRRAEARLPQIRARLAQRRRHPADPSATTEDPRGGDQR